ncbi:substrate-binding periplasmic protein [Paucibacter sp. Y2R2-4]|uniref:substrate-binding periplasmic protein n=1 Tax=Paucibacter sp. Y2R2-4 TaxID=2893553 RepID=UPI0021E3BC6A|nr:transporter substrate-binding domain-containing protein [Paucibacter sp. Y2R2-4]MCV2350419.1 transporter substrate-binding domain-containing protein [Paucibacter sp. Y2R2-4]
MPSSLPSAKRCPIRRTLAALLLCAALPCASAAEFKVDLIQFDPWAKPNPDPALSAKEPYVGIIVDLLKEFERRSGHSTVRMLTPYARVERDLQVGDIDFSIMAWGDARAAYASRGTALVPLEFGVRARQGVPLKSYEDLKNIVTAAPRGLKVDPRFDVDPTVRKELVLDYTQAIRISVANRDAKAVAGSLSTLGHLIHKFGLEAEFGDVLVLNTTHLTVAFSRKSTQLAAEAQVNAVFKTMVEDGTAKKIYERWMFPPKH